MADPGGRAVYSVGLQPSLVGIAGSNPACAMDVCCECGCQVEVSASG